MTENVHLGTAVYAPTDEELAKLEATVAADPQIRRINELVAISASRGMSAEEREEWINLTAYSDPRFGPGEVCRGDLPEDQKYYGIPRSEGS